ncbi:MAG: DegV family protein [Clostridiales bacterium]
MIRIVSDSSTLYSIEEARKNNLDIAPLAVTIDGKTYKELEDIQTEQFIDIIDQGHLPVSSQPAIGEVIEIFKKYPHDEIINIAMADGLSGTYNSACMAKGMVENGDAITVINSKTLCGPHRYLVDLALKMVELGKSKTEIISVIEEMIELTKSYLIPNDFEYLVRGGRLSPLVGRISIIIKLVPVLTPSEDGTRLQKFTIKRTFKKAVDAICLDLKEMGIDENYKIYISHACNETQANYTKAIIEQNIANADIEMNMLTPAFTTQGGPRCISVQIIKKHQFMVQH